MWGRSTTLSSSTLWLLTKHLQPTAPSATAPPSHEECGTERSRVCSNYVTTYHTYRDYNLWHQVKKTDREIEREKKERVERERERERKIWRERWEEKEKEREKERDMGRRKK